MTDVDGLVDVSVWVTEAVRRVERLDCLMLDSSRLVEECNCDLLQKSLPSLSLQSKRWCQFSGTGSPDPDSPP